MDSTHKGRVKPRSLKVGTFNAAGLARQRDLIHEFLREHQLDILLVQETFLKPQHRNPSIANYNIVRNDRLNAPLGGTLIYYKKSLHCIPMDPPALTHIEASVCRLDMTGHQPIILVSAYMSPNPESIPTPILRADLEALLGLGNAVLIAGDLNAKNIRWNCVRTNPKGRQLEDLAERLNYDIITPLEPTRYPTTWSTARPNILDLALFKAIQLRLHSVEVVHELISDHRPVVIELASRLGHTDLGHTGGTRTVVTDWVRLEKDLESSASVITEQLPERYGGADDTAVAIDRFTTHVQSLISDCSREVTSEDRRFNLPDDVRELVRRKNAATRAHDRCPTEANRAHLRSLRREVRDRIKEMRQTRWDSLLSELEPSHLAFWQLSRSLTKDVTQASMPPLNRPNNTPACDDKDKTECLAESLERQCSLDTVHVDSEHLLEVDSEVQRRASLPLPPLSDSQQTDDDNYVAPFTTDEVRDVIKKLHPRKAPGSDGITNRAIKLFPQSLIVLLTAIYNAALEYNIFPQQWKEAVVIGIPKPGKPRSEPASYRPISLLKGLGKVYERLLYVRLKAHVDASLLLPHEQFGFRTKHSCVHQVHRIVEYINVRLQRNLFTGVLFFDVAKAFDRVWHNGLIYKLHTMGVPHKLVLIIQDYLAHRTFRYRVEGTLSNPHSVRAGTPQGSVLSPLLYSLYTADIPIHRNGVQTALFADDTAIYCAGSNPRAVSRKLQTAANALSDWFKKWRIEVNPDKSQAVLFHRRKRSLYPPGATPQIKMSGSYIPWTKEAKYLGVILDDKLTFNTHLKTVRNRAAFVLGRLHSLINKRSTLSLRNKIRLYTSCVRPIMTYASVVFAHKDTYRIHRLQTLQNNFMRRATGAPWFMRNEDLHVDLQLPTIRQFMKRCSRSYFDSASTHPNPLVVEAVNYSPSMISRVRRPRHILLEDDDATTLAQRAYTAREATTNRPRFRLRRRGRNTRRANVRPVGPLRLTLPSNAQAEVRGSPPLG